MKNKNLIKIICGIAIGIILILTLYFVFFKEDKDNTLTLIEKQWIQNNKNKLNDLSIINKVPVISYNGEGIFFDFLNSLEKSTNLSFNKIAYTSGENPKSEYSLKVVDNIGNNELELYEDNYVLVTKNGQVYSSIDQIKNLTVGVFNSKLSLINTYLNPDSNVLLKSYDNYENMINDIDKTGDNGKPIIDGIVLPKTAYLDAILKNTNLTISYNISELKEYYVLHLGNIDRLNDIIKKYFKKWHNDNYEKSSLEQFFNSYFEFSDVDDREKVEFKSKRYVYGFTDNRPYDTLYDNSYLGINHAIITSFEKFANIEIDYKRYNSVDSLIKDFNSNNIDFIFNNTSTKLFQMDVNNTLSIYDEKIVVLSNPKNNLVINSIASLNGKNVSAVKSSYISYYLSNYGAVVKDYNDIKKLLADTNEDSILAMDFDTYQYYSATDLKNFKVNYITDLKNDYCFTVRNISDNNLFTKLLNFYLSFFSNDKSYNAGYNEVLKIRSNKISVKTIILCIIATIFASICVFFGIKYTHPVKKKKVKINLSKEDKIKYVDMLTSLKNRTYLNDNIEKWDNSEVYPQTIVIIDLNNITYINDNYGHTEGDKVIGEAANILINSQLPNTEIMRTNGNEFLVYMVGYDEKQVISYIKKLVKEFKSLTHGFGAALGYSMITDAIKTVDDAINEATTDMRENKEELDY